MAVNLPDIQLNDIGKPKDGASPGEVAEKIFASLQRQIKKVVNPLDIGQAKKMVKGAVSDIKDKVESGLGNPKELLGKPEELLGKNVEDVGNAVKGLFGD